MLKLGTVNKERLRTEEVTGEPRWGCCPLTGESEKKGGLEDRFRGLELAQDELSLPTPPLVASLWGPLEFRREVKLTGPGGRKRAGGHKGVLPGERAPEACS